jgi:hypothetical protein
MARSDKLRDAGYVRIPGVAARHYRAPDGKEVSYRQAFLAARGESLEAATKKRGGPGKFHEEFHLADQTRAAARAGLLSKARLMSREEEKQVAASTLRSLWKGHGRRYQYLEGEVPEEIMEQRPGPLRYREDEIETNPPERETVYSRRVLAVLDDPGGNSRLGKKAKLLEAIGRRAPNAEYDVGDTP